MLSFELKKVFKSKTFLLCLILALVLVLFGFFYRDLTHMVDITKESIGHETLFEYVISDVGLETEIVNGEEVVVDQPEDLTNDFKDLMTYGPTSTLERDSKIVDFEFYNKLDHFLDHYNLKIKSDYLRDDYNYALSLREYLYKQDISPEDYLTSDNFYTQSKFVMNLDILFGYIPLILFFFIAALLVSAKYEQTQIDLDWLQPRTKKKSFLIDLLSKLAFVFLYILFVFGIVFIFGLLKGNQQFLWELPLHVRRLGAGNLSLSGYIFRTVLLFLMKAMLFISLGTLIGLIFKSKSETILTVSMLTVLGLVLTSSFEIFQHFLNPFFINYNQWILGSRIIDYSMTELGSYLYAYLPPSLTISSIVIFLMIVLVVICISFFLLPKERGIFTKAKSKRKKSGKTLFSFENYKFNQYLDPKLIYGLTLFLLLFLIFLDVQAVNSNIHYSLYESSELQTLYSEKEMYEINKDNVSEALAKETDEDEKERLEGEIEAYDKQLLLTQKKIDEALKLSRYYENKDSKAYYDTLEKNFQLSKEEDLYDSVFTYYIPENNMPEEDLVANQILPISEAINNEYREQLQEAHLKPLVLKYDQVLSRYDQTKDPNQLKEGLANQLPDDSSSFILLYRLLKTPYFAMLIVLISVLVYGANYYTDFESSDSLDLVYTLPIDRKKYFSVKYVTGITKIIKYLIFILMIILLFGLVKDPRNTLNFPVLIYKGVIPDLFATKELSSYYFFIPLWKYLISAILLIISLIHFLYALSQFFAVRLKNRIKIYLAVAGVLGIGLALLFLFPKYAVINPIAYFDLLSVLDGSMTIKYGLERIYPLYGVIVLNIAALIIFLMGRYSKKLRTNG